jgi:hypothetical protein
MTVRELIQFLQNQDQNARVFMMTQPNYPMMYALGGACTSQQLEEMNGDEPSENCEVYLVEGYHVGYGDRDAWEFSR